MTYLDIWFLFFKQQKWWYLVSNFRYLAKLHTTYINFSAWLSFYTVLQSTSRMKGPEHPVTLSRTTLKHSLRRELRTELSKHYWREDRIPTGTPGSKLSVWRPSRWCQTIQIWKGLVSSSRLCISSSCFLCNACTCKGVSGIRKKELRCNSWWFFFWNFGNDTPITWLFVFVWQ